MMRSVKPFVRAMSLAIPIAALAVLTGCEKADNAPGPGGVTMGEARALDEAAQMLDARRPPPGLAQPSRTQWPEGQDPGREGQSLGPIDSDHAGSDGAVATPSRGGR